MLLQVNGLGAAFTAIQAAGAFNEISVLEMIPLNRSAQVLFQGSNQNLIQLRKLLPTADLQKSVIIADPHPSVLKAFYHLETSALIDDLVVLEGEFVGYVLETLDNCLKAGMKLIDFRQPKHPDALSSAFLSAKNVDEDLAKKFGSKHVNFTWVNDPNQALQKFFEFEKKN
jgi:hypothetical protein